MKKGIMMTMIIISLMMLSVYPGGSWYNPKPSNSSAENGFVQLAPSCTDWMKQENGCYWRTCVGDDGKQYCEECCPDANGNCVAQKVECK